MKRFYLLDLYDMETGETLEKTGFPTKSNCIEHFKKKEKEFKKELDYWIREVFIDEGTDVCNV